MGQTIVPMMLFASIPKAVLNADVKRDSKVMDNFALISMNVLTMITINAIPMLIA